MNTDNLNRYGHALDPRGLTQLRADLKNPTPEAAREVAKQFEAMFVQQMLKTMRAASGGDSLVGGQAEGQYRDLFDQQIAMNAAQGRGLGLAPVIERQLLAGMGYKPEDAGGAFRASGNLAGAAEAGASAGAGANSPAATAALSLDKYLNRIPSRPVQAATEAAVPAQPAEKPPAATALGAKAAAFDSPADFVRSVWKAAERTAERLGVPVKALVAQAALETGWGKHVIQKGDGDSSFNLFGIKSHRAWSGDSVKVPTLEYRDGVAAKELASFRAYGSLDQAFEDYADFLQSNPRYSDALQAGDDAEAFARGLQEAGYATDPAYADKIRRIMESPILSDAVADLI